VKNILSELHARKLEQHNYSMTRAGFYFMKPIEGFDKIQAQDISSFRG
jgi:hypothetical protein